MLKIYSVFFISLLLVQNVYAANAAGMFMSTKGDVKVTSQGNTLPAKVGMKYFVGDIVVTGTDGRAKITMQDRNNIFVSPNSSFSLDKYDTGKKQNVEINLKEGKIRNEVNNKYDGEKSKFLIKTPTAVAGVRGTDFVTSFNKTTQVTEVVTIKGSVTLNSFGSAGNVIVPAGQSSAVKPNEVPAPPAPIAPDKIKEVQQEFSVATTPPTSEVAGQEKLPVAGGDTSGDSRAPASDTTSPVNSTPTTTTDGAGRMTDTQDQTPDTFERAPMPGPVQRTPTTTVGGGTPTTGGGYTGGTPGGITTGGPGPGSGLNILPNKKEIKIITRPPGVQ